MSIERFVFSRQGAISGARLRELAGAEGLEVRLMDVDGRPMAAGEDGPLEGQGYVVVGWSKEDVTTTGAVDLAIQAGDKGAVDRLGVEGKLGWCSVSCGAFDFGEYEEAMREGMEEDEEGAHAEDMEMMRGVKTEYLFRCGTRPKLCGEVLGKVAGLVQGATDGFGDE